MSQESLVGISEACQILGVSETALRQWTDEGKIKAFVTPGGHRRYYVANLKKFMSVRQKPVGIKDLAVELEDTAVPLRDIARTLLPEKAWYNKLDTDSQKHLAGLGHNMLQVIIKYATEPSKRDEAIKTSREVGCDFGHTLARLGVPLTDSVEAFVMHRDPIMNAATFLMMRKEAVTGRAAEAVRLLTHVIDEALIALVAAHQQVQKDMQGGIGKEPGQ